MNEKIFDLLENKDYSDLSKDELSLVNEYYNFAEYKAAQQSIIQTTLLFNDEIGRVAMDEEIILGLNTKLRSNPSIFYKLTHARVSLLKAIAIFILLLTFYSLLIFNRFTKGGNQQIANIVITDTIRLTEVKYVDKTDTVYIIKKQSRKRTKTSNQLRQATVQNAEKRDLKKLNMRTALQTIEQSKSNISRGINKSHENSPQIYVNVMSDQIMEGLEYCCN